MAAFELAPPPSPQPKKPIARVLPLACPSCNGKYCEFEDGTTDKVDFNCAKCELDVLRNKERSAPQTHRCACCAAEDWNYGKCDVCHQDGFCDIVGLVGRSDDPAALQVCYDCALAGKYSRKWQKTSWEKATVAGKYPRELEKTSAKQAQNPLGIAKRGSGAIAKQTR